MIALLATGVLALLACLGRPTGPRRPPRRPVAVYNLTHRLAGPFALLAIGPALTYPAVLAAALGWAAHIILDRAAGYTLRNPDRSQQ